MQIELHFHGFFFKTEEDNMMVGIFVALSHCVHEAKHEQRSLWTNSLPAFLSHTSCASTLLSEMFDDPLPID